MPYGKFTVIVYHNSNHGHNEWVVYLCKALRTEESEFVSL